MTGSDDRLVQLLAAGSPEAIEMLYDRYGRLAFSLANRVVSDASVAEDVVQEAFLAVWRNSDSYRPDRGSVRTWLCTIVHNRALDRLRGKSGRARRDLSLEVLPVDRSDGEQDGVWRTVAEEMERDRVRRAVETLSPDQRQAIELAYYSGYSQSEIAELTKVPLGTIKGRTRLALTKLRHSLEAEGVSWPN